MDPRTAKQSLQIESGILAMTIALSDSGLLSESLTINGGDILEKESAGIAFRFPSPHPIDVRREFSRRMLPNYITHEQRQRHSAKLDEQTRQLIGGHWCRLYRPIDIDGRR
jgi:hypothetical protein